jgi:hypothetical protein
MLASISERTPAFVLIWLFIVLVSWAGLGSLFGRLLPQRPDFGLRAAWGMALSISVGGALNLLGLVSPVAIFALVISGVVPWVVDATVYFLNFIKLGRWKRQYLTLTHLFLLLVVALTCALIALRLLQLVCLPPMFNGYDDFHAYLVFPIKMLQLHSLTPDPFNSTRLGALGGQSFLQLFALSAAPFTYVKVIDPGLCAIVCSALLFGHQEQNRGGVLSKALSALLPLVLLPAFFSATNISSHVSSMALYLALFRTFEFIRFANSRTPVVNGIAVAFIAAGTVSLKSTAVPFVALLLVVHYLSELFLTANRRLPIYEAIVAGVLTIILLLPWMLLMRESSGTYLYPYLGNGYSGTGYGTFPVWSRFSRLRDFFQDPLFFAIIILSTFYLYWYKVTVVERARTLSLITATVGGTLAINWATAGLARYTIPFTLVTVFALISDLARETEHLSKENKPQQMIFEKRRPNCAILFTVFIATWALLSWPQTKAAIMNWSFFWRETKAKIQLVLRDKSTTRSLFAVDWARNSYYKDQAKAIALAQKSIPQSQMFLAKLSEPFLLQFSDNQIYVVDWPYGSSLPPGMPFRRGADALAEYFLSKSIRYVLYEPDKSGWRYYPHGGDIRCRDPKSAVQLLSRSNGESGEEAYECGMDLSMADFLENLDELVKTRHAIFDDGKFIVLDLSMRR